jgi:cathepsin L
MYSSSEYTDRKAIFEKRLRIIREHNAQNHSWKMGLNKFSDWTPSEVADKMTGLDLHDGRKFAAHLVHRLPPGFKATDLPDSMDWRNASPSVITPIKEQGLCGSCWAFAATEAIESAAAIATGKLQVLGPQQLVSCAPNPDECGGTGGCDGSIPSVGFNYTMSSGGLSLESSYPYTHTDKNCNSSKIQPVVGVTGFVDIPNNNATLLMHALTLGPVAINAAANW